MPDWLLTALDEPRLLDHLHTPAIRVALAVLAGFLAAGVYVTTFGRRRKDARSLAITLVLLAVLVSVLTQVIGDNMARAFGLVGALSIVRFRTVVEDTADTAFVIFAVTVGMAVGAGHAALAGICIPAVAVVAALMNGYDQRKANGTGTTTLAVRLGLGFDPDAALKPVFADHLAAVKLTRTETALKGVAVEFTYLVKLKDPAAAFRLVSDLNKTEGVQGVDLKGM
jgi:MFS family permease